MDSTPAQVYEFGKFRVDAPRRLLLDRDGQPLPLTPKAFDTLLFLLENRSQVVSKEQLMKAVWPKLVVEENNLNQNISALRRVLGETRGEHQFIVTVPGRGYRFVADVSTRVSRKDSVADSATAIAVLPFMPLVTDHREPALELGMADTLIARLSAIRRIVVRPLSSVRKYIDIDQDPLRAGRELGVDSIVEGTIQRWGDAIRVTARLMNVTSGTAMWSGTFDEKFSGIFEVQDAICERIAAALTVKLQQDERNRLNRRYTENAEVYELYLKGRFHAWRLTPPEMQKGITYFHSALAIDPSYAPAYLGLAGTEFRLPLAGELSSLEHYPKARSAAQKALEIDDMLAEGHAILGWIKFWFEWNWGEAESCFRRALEIDPNDTESHLGYAHMLSNTGRHDEALAQARRARELSPLLLAANALEGQFLLHAGRIEEAAESLRRTCALDENFWLSRMYLANVYTECGRYEEAAAEAELARKASGGACYAGAAAVCALAKLGRQDEARSILSELVGRSARRYVPPYAMAMAWNGLEELEETWRWLERGLEQRDPGMTFLKVQPKWNNIRRTARFQHFLRRANLIDATADMR